MILLTGSSGFIGRAIHKFFNSLNINDIISIDKDIDFNKIVKLYPIHSIVHIGAISDTLEKNKTKIQQYNIDYTNNLFDYALYNNIPFIFTSTAAIYGNNNFPLNLYAESKLASEKYINNRAVVLRLFNVYGPDESHKGRMASTIYHWYHQLKDSENIKIFENSYQYYRDFIYINDVCEIIYRFLNNYVPGTYDVGTGECVSFEHVADSIIRNIGYGRKQYIKMPQDLKQQYQTYTKANIKYPFTFNSRNITSGIKLYIDHLNGI
jgi:ADP-L-glycero-D-manno-heptose 6-epimerase